ncbi:GDP-L-fucose synthase family protein [Microbulbifer echini]|uniref:GDP-L-fucose synthase n=1 Tax=Microbulbifer echini TaxID=1529067 RepID=A0ABV4NRE0_9GAMM
MHTEKRVFLAGHNGMVGSALHRALLKEGCKEIITLGRGELDLTNQAAVEKFLYQEKPDIIYLAAAKVGGVFANNEYPAEFIYENLMIQNNLIHYAHKVGVQNLLFLGSSCIYPRICPQPIVEGALLQGGLEPTNEPYAVAKIAGIKLCEAYSRQYGRDYRSVMPTNLYGPGDNFHFENSHVIPALIRRFHEAKSTGEPEVVIWGTGTPMREFLYVDDLAEACIYIMNMRQGLYRSIVGEKNSHVNVGYGKDCSIEYLAKKIAATVGYSGSLKFDTSKPDGTPRKLLDTSLLSELGWAPKTMLGQGLRNTYEWYSSSLKGGSVSSVRT